MANQHKNIIVNTIYDGLMVTDTSGAICLVNRRAQDILGYPEEKMLGQHLNQFFSIRFMQTLERNNNLVDVQEEIYVKGQKIKCTITTQRILADGRYNGTVIVFNEISRAKKLINKLLVPEARWTFGNMVGSSEKFRAAVDSAMVVASMESNVLLLGESGAGKEVFAQAIHNASDRRRGPFIALNCGGIPKELIGSELFGYAEGAFTGATKGGRMGKFELADGGTLFLDEIGEMPIEQQRVLLRVIEEKRITRLGGQESVPVDVRITAATNKDLIEETQKGAFRQDLFYRLNVFAINIPPLRNRKDDIIALTKAFIEQLTAKLGLVVPVVDEDVWGLLLSYDWPGNVRELHNAVERAVVLSKGEKITAKLLNLPEAKTAPNSVVRTANPIKNDLRDYEANILKGILQRNNWNITRTSLEMGVSRTTLYRKMGVLGIYLPAGHQNSH